MRTGRAIRQDQYDREHGIGTRTRSREEVMVEMLEQVKDLPADHPTRLAVEALLAK